MHVPTAVGEFVMDTEYFYGRGIGHRDFEYQDKGGEVRTAPWYGYATTLPDAPTIVFALTPDRQVVVISQWRPWPQPDVIWELPGGNARHGETPVQVAGKELLAESGYVGQVSMIKPGVNFFDPASYTVGHYAVKATACRLRQDPDPGRTEFLESKVIDLAKWVEMIKRGEVHDNKTIAVTFQALLQLELLELKL